VAVAVKQLIAAQQLTAAAATYYTVPLGTNTRVTEVLVCNNDASVDRNFSMYFVAPAGAAAAANRVINQVPIPAGQTIQFVLSSVLPAGAMIQMLASAAATLTVHASGAELT
jgi:hypothetical protein